MEEHNDIAIKVERVSKDFRLPHERAGSVKNLVTHLINYVRVSRKYAIQHALKDISFEVKKGEFFGIVGRNGSGKSTMLKMLAGIYQPNKGTITVKGKLVPFIELGVGFNGELTGRENVYLNGALMGFTKKEIDAQYQDIVAFAELEDFMDQKLKNYSSGMQVRLAFSLAIRAETDILLVDEVLAVGDADFQRKCFDYFRNLKKNKKTVVFVSHDMNAIREYCDKAIMIEKSKLVASGQAGDVAQKYTRLFIEQESSKDDIKPGDKRWGDGSLTYTNIQVSPRELADDSSSITIIAKAKANTRPENPIFGFSVKNAAGQYILGTNTKIKHLKIPKLKEGDEITLKWSLPNIFNDGTYFITPTIIKADGITECDWWEDAIHFKVYKEEKTLYPVNPNISVELQSNLSK